MNATLVFWTLVFFAVSCALLLLPFYPAWQEWRHPVDALRLSIQSLAPPHLEPLTAQMRLMPGATPPDTVRASARILAPSGCKFHKLCAPTILLGIADAAPNQPRRVQSIPLLKLDRAKRWGTKGWRIDGDCRIPQAHYLQGNLVVTGTLHIEADCVIHGDIKTHGAVHVGPRSQLSGALFSTQAITLQESAEIQGPVVSDTSVSIGPWVLIGNLEHPSMVSAPQIAAHASAVVHGTVWAQVTGRVM